MDKTAIKTTRIWVEKFTQEERDQLRVLLHIVKSERNEEENELVRRYWRLQKDRSRTGLARLDSKRINKGYQKWLKLNGLATKPFKRSHWDRFVRQGDGK
ncbi:MAG: hypothetical protein DRJ03_04690 [Chloroflexi bacterium]|nr:MAG: hypothetical protein DRJ03_04690 [Chloroflexota bacterium]